MEPNVNKYCLICKDTDASLKLVAEKEYLCPTCLEAYPEKSKKAEPEKPKKVDAKKSKKAE